MNLEHATPDLFAALAVAQGAIEGAKKDSTNPAFKSKYADLSSVIEAAQKPLATSGLSLTFSMGHEPTGIAVTPLLAHKTGGYILFDTLRVPCEAKAQQQGSAMTYARRYLTMSILGIPTEDDDGNAASEPKPQKPAPRPAPGPAPNPSPTHREQVKAFLTEIKPQLSAEQIAELSNDITHAGTTDALLNGVMEKAKRMIGVAS